MIALTRAQFVQLAGIDVDLFKTLWRRGQVPLLAGGPTSGKADKDKTRNAYLPLEALLLALSNDLSSHHGLDRSMAYRIVQGWANQIVDGIPRAEAGEDIWLGVFFDFRNGLPGLGRAGTLTELVDHIQKFEFKGGLRPYTKTYRIVFVCISRAVAQIYKRANDLNLNLISILKKPTETGRRKAGCRNV